MSVKSIQVYGSGCPSCKHLFELVKKIAKELKIEVEVEYITDIAKIVELGVMSSPVVSIDGKVALVGGHISGEDIKNALLKKSEPKNNSCGNCASCGCC